MDEANLRGEIAALRDLLERLAESRSRRDWDELMDRADARLVAIAQCLDALLETEGQLARRVTQILVERGSDPGTQPAGPCGDAP
jgi:hypothetical protein